MVLVLAMLPIVSKELGKAHFNTVIPWTWVVVQGEVTRGDCAPIWGDGQRMGFTVLEEGLIEGFLCAVPLVVVDELPTLDLLREAVFLMLLWLVELGLLSVLVPSDSSMGSQKVTPLAVFLLLPWEGGSATWSI